MYDMNDRKNRWNFMRLPYFLGICVYLKKFSSFFLPIRAEFLLIPTIFDKKSRPIFHTSHGMIYFVHYFCFEYILSVFLPLPREVLNSLIEIASNVSIFYALEVQILKMLGVACVTTIFLFVNSENVVCESRIACIFIKFSLSLVVCC